MMRRGASWWGLGLAVGFLAGCINTEFGCKGFPDGASCQAVSQVLALDPSETGGYLTGEGGKRTATASAGAADEAPARATDRSRAAAGEIPVQLGKPILRAPDVLRVWLAPWTDEQDRLHEASYVYLQAGDLEWAYTGPQRPGKRSDRFGTPIVPRPPAEAGARASSGASSAGGSPARLAPATAVARPPASPADAKAASAGSGAQAPSGSLLMVPTPQGGQRPVVIPQIPAPGARP